MNPWERHVVPSLVSCACSMRPIMKQRERIVPQAEGVVLEIGCGAGANFALYDTAKVEHVYALEPAPGMVTKARRKAGELGIGRSIQFLETGAEAIPLADHSVDTAVITFVLCTISDFRSALAETRRVLKPGGRILFSEHGLSPAEGVGRRPPSRGHGEDFSSRGSIMSKSLVQALVDSGAVSKSDLEPVLGEARNETELIDLLTRRGLVDAPTLLQLRADALGVTWIELTPYSIDPEAVRSLNEDLARRHACIAMFRVGNDLTLGMADPTDVVAIDTIRDSTGCEVIPVLAMRSDIERAINQFYGIDPILKRLVSEAQRAEGMVEVTSDESELSLEELAADQSPIVRIVNLIVLKAIRDGASDVHLEPDHDVLRVRYRVDGRLGAEQRIPLNLHAGMVSRLKILADLDLAQKRLPQDGRISLRAEGRRIDLRVSTLPTVRGEKMVLRLLDTQQTLTSLDDLGLAPALHDMWKDLIALPHGMILVTGPTGSGKTTSLYASLAAINKLDTNIVTVEDPVEFDFPVINQVQVNTKAGLTFASALRSILRQDPNVVMIGEIRDRETAQIAIRAALTGHLVLSTLHTNDASSAPTRLIDMGVEPYLVASALKGVLAQRLVRRNCSRCTQEIELDRTRYPMELVDRIARVGGRVKQGKGCRSCNHSGYRGRVALHELMVVGDEVERAIVRQLSAAQTRQIARRSGMSELFDDGVTKAIEGLTSIEQVLLATRMGEEDVAPTPLPTPPGSQVDADDTSGPVRAITAQIDELALEPRFVLAPSFDPHGDSHPDPHRGE